MSNKILNNLLKEYAQKKLRAELDLEDRKDSLYLSIPRLKEIEDELNNYAINTAKSFLKNGTSSLEDLYSKIDLLKNERSQILKNNNLSEDYLRPIYECKICNDTGYISHDNYKTEFCNCLKQKLLNISYNKSNISGLDKENFNTFNENLFSDDVDLSKYKLNISPRKNMVNIKNKCIDFVNNFENLDQKNLLFTGNTGLGKTFMSNCIANELLKKGKTVLYQTAPVLLETIIDNKMNKQKSNKIDDFYKNVLDVDLLIIDDLGTECINSMKLSELFTIINTRLLNLNSKPTKTIISTNLSLNNIFSNYEERIGSRIAGFYDIYYFFGDDIRFKNKK